MVEFKNPKYFRTALRIGLSDIDTAGFVYHGNYYHIYNRARDEFFRAIGFSYARLMDKGLHLGVAHIDCSYKKPLEYDELIYIDTTVVWLKEKAMGIEQRLYRDADNQLCNEVKYVFVCIDKEVNAVKVPEALSSSIEAWSHE